MTRTSQGSPAANMSESPWRSLFETVRGALGNRRDKEGVVGSINWLRQRMTERGANPNVVRNIIYRNKGKLADKRVLFALLSELWESAGHPPLEAPEIELLLSSAPEDESAAQGLGRDKRRVYTGFVGAVRSGRHPKLLVTGRPGSGKTLLTDAVQGTLERALQGSAQSTPERTPKYTPEHAPEVIRQEFSALNLADALLHLSLALGAAQGAFETKLVKVGVAGAYSVQADAQADVARVVLEQLRGRRDPAVLLLHVSQTSSAPSGTKGLKPTAAKNVETLGDAPLRLNTPDVPRVGLNEWLWHTLLEPLGRLNNVSLLVSMSELPPTLSERTGAFEGPVKLSPPTTAEARRFVRTRAPHLSEAQRDALVGRGKRSFEDLRTLTLLAEAREPLGESHHSEQHAGQTFGQPLTTEQTTEQPTRQLSQLVAGGSGRLRDFLEVLAVLSLPEFPGVAQTALEALRSAEPEALTPLELAFLDAVPGEPVYWRPFSRQFSRSLRDRLRTANSARFRLLSGAAARLYEQEARCDPRSDAAARYVHHLFAARDWDALTGWAEHARVPQPLLGQLWRAAQSELAGDPVTLGAVALRVASYYVRLGSPEHPDAKGALAVLAASSDPKLRGWTRVKRAESALLEGRYSETEALLQGWQDVGEPGLEVEVTLLQANLARWRSRLPDAAALARKSAEALAQMSSDPVLAVRVGLWSGIVAKDAGRLAEALEHLHNVATEDELFRARIRFQEADVFYRLGHLSRAHAALTEAVHLSAQGEAPAFERARYLARRGTLRRRQGDLSAAQGDFAAAHAALLSAEDETQPPTRPPLRFRFERAKVCDEAALNALAQGHTDDAILTLQEDLETFAAYGRCYGVDPSFRVLRGTLRLALAYGCRALGQRYLFPLGPYSEEPTKADLPADLPADLHADLRRARELVTGVLATLAGEQGRYTGLVTQAQLASSLLLGPTDAVREAAAALASAHDPYERGRTGTYLAGALLRRGDPENARTAGAAAEHELHDATTDDYGLYAQLALTDAAARLELGDPAGAQGHIFSALQDPHLTPYHEALLRRFGRIAERSRVPLSAAALGLGDAPLPGTLRLADALVLRLRQRYGPYPQEQAEPAEPVEKARQ